LIFGWFFSINYRQIKVSSNPNLVDKDGDTLDDYGEYTVFLTNPNSIDSDSDGSPDLWEVKYYFSLTDFSDSFKDPDYDGLSNIHDYNLGTILNNGVLSYDQDLFLRKK